MLYGCEKCKENSVVRKVYIRKSDSKQNRVEFCINKGCGYKRELPFYKLATAVAAILLIAINIGVASADGASARGGTIRPTPINMDVIRQIESNGNPKAYHKGSGARGLYQITPIVLIEFNNYHKNKYSKADLFNPAVNYEIALWYFAVRLPKLLKYYNKPITINNLLIAYNAGIRYVVNGGRLPRETINYINRYQVKVGGL